MIFLTSSGQSGVNLVLSKGTVQLRPRKFGRDGDDMWERPWTQIRILLCSNIKKTPGGGFRRGKPSKTWGFGCHMFSSWVLNRITCVYMCIYINIIQLCGCTLGFKHIH